MNKIRFTGYAKQTPQKKKQKRKKNWFITMSFLTKCTSTQVYTLPLFYRHHKLYISPTLSDIDKPTLFFNNQSYDNPLAYLPLTWDMSNAFHTAAVLSTVHLKFFRRRTNCANSCTNLTTSNTYLTSQHSVEICVVPASIVL